MPVHGGEADAQGGHSAPAHTEDDPGEDRPDQAQAQGEHPRLRRLSQRDARHRARLGKNRRKPSGPALRLLEIADKTPDILVG